jgi:hypothetical protein
MSRRGRSDIHHEFLMRGGQQRFTLRLVLGVNPKVARERFQRITPFRTTRAMA